MSAPLARILDRGYRRYDGPRLGPGHAVRSVVAHTLRRLLGLRRPARSKVLPVLSIALAYVPAIVFVGVVALTSRFGDKELARQLVPSYASYYGFVLSAIMLFVAFAAPEALCPDRRSRTLSLYLASPLTRTTYLGAKVGAVAAVLAFVTVGPPLLLLVGLSFQGIGPDGVDGFLGVLVRVLVAGALLSLLYTAISAGVASLTDRRAVAAAATLLVFAGSGIVTATVVFGLGGPAEVLALSLTRGPFELVSRIYGETGVPPRVPTGVLVAGALSWTAAGAAVAAVRYRRLRVTR